MAGWSCDHFGQYCVSSFSCIRFALTETLNTAIVKFTLTSDLPFNSTRTPPLRENTCILLWWSAKQKPESRTSSAAGHQVDLISGAALLPSRGLVPSAGAIRELELLITTWVARVECFLMRTSRRPLDQGEVLLAICWLEISSILQRCNKCTRSVIAYWMCVAVLGPPVSASSWCPSLAMLRVCL